MRKRTMILSNDYALMLYIDLYATKVKIKGTKCT